MSSGCSLPYRIVVPRRIVLAIRLLGNCGGTVVHELEYIVSCAAWAKGMEHRYRVLSDAATTVVLVT